MATFRSKLPTRQDSLLLYAACAFPVYSWSVLRYFWMVPSWRKYLGFWDMASILAYALAFSLGESILGFLPLVLIHVVLPTPIVRKRFVSKGAALVLVNVLWAIVLHNVILSGYILRWTVARYVLCVTLYLMSVAVTWTLVHRHELFAEYTEAFVDRLTVLVYIYVPLSAVSVLIVIVRNIL